MLSQTSVNQSLIQIMTEWLKSVENHAVGTKNGRAVAFWRLRIYGVSVLLCYTLFFAADIMGDKVLDMV